MRGGLIIVGFIFWLCVSWSPLGEIAWRKGCEVRQSKRYLNGEYTSVFNGLLNRGNNQKSIFSILKQNPFYFFATEYDTTRLSGFTDRSFDGLDQIDFSLVFSDHTVHNRESIKYSLPQGHEPNERYLMEVHEAGLHYIGAAEIVEAQLDSDPERERIVKIHSGEYATFIFYEGYGSYWQYVDAVTVEDGMRMTDLDFSLDGFVGISTHDYGTEHGTTDATYYTYDRGNLVECFTINKESSINLTGYVAEEFINMNSQTTPLLVNSDEIFIEHSIEVVKESLADSLPHTIIDETISYSLVMQPDGHFIPNKKLPGFNVRVCAEECDSTHFYPEVYANTKLIELKENGTIKQKDLLKSISLDSVVVLQ